jgi:hypothetical protein
VFHVLKLGRLDTSRSSQDLGQSSNLQSSIFNTNAPNLVSKAEM